MGFLGCGWFRRLETSNRGWVVPREYQPTHIQFAVVVGPTQGNLKSNKALRNFTQIRGVFWSRPKEVGVSGLQTYASWFSSCICELVQLF